MKYLHISKSFLGGSGKTFRHNDSKAAQRADRRCGAISARQQRIAKKVWRAEQRYEARLNQEIANTEANLDWQEDEAECMAYERERRADELYEEHFGAA
jgi:hypothetical protein